MSRWGIISTGKMSAVFADEFQYAAGADLVAASSRTKESAEAFARAHGLDRGLTHAELLADPEIDVVYVATPHPQHKALAEAALRAGKHVLVEKAFTATLDGAVELARVAQESGRFCMEAMWTRFQPAAVRAREMVDAGAIGDVLLVQVDFGAFRAFDPQDRLFDPALGGGATLDLGVYPLSLAHWFLGAPDSVTAHGRLYPNGVDAAVTVQLGFPEGRSGSVAYGFTTPSPGRAIIWGDAGSLELGPRFHHPTTLIIRRPVGEPEVLDVPARGQGYAHEIDHVEECLAAGLTESPVLPLADTIEVQRTMQQVLEQLGIEPHEDDRVAL